MFEKDSDEEDYMEIQRQMKMGSQKIGDVDPHKDAGSKQIQHILTQMGLSAEE